MSMKRPGPRENTEEKDPTAFSTTETAVTV